MSFVIAPRSGPKQFDEASHGPDMAELAAREAEIAQRVKRELAKTRAAAETRGHAEGFAAGRAQAEAAMQSAATALGTAAAQLTAPLGLKRADLADLTVKLARRLATHVIGYEIATNLDAITNLASQLLDAAAIERMAGSHICLRFNPADHAALSNLTLPAETTMQPDPAIAQGGAMLEITHTGATKPAAIWDATIQTRLAGLL